MNTSSLECKTRNEETCSEVMTKSLNSINMSAFECKTRNEEIFPEIMRSANTSYQPQQLFNCKPEEIILSSNVVETVMMEKTIKDKDK